MTNLGCCVVTNKRQKVTRISERLAITIRELKHIDGRNGLCFVVTGSADFDKCMHAPFSFLTTPSILRTRYAVSVSGRYTMFRKFPNR